MFTFSLVLGVTFAIAVVYSRHLQNTIYPLIVILYAMPKSAFAPLMVIWVGYGLMSKIAIAFLVAFFPIVVNTVVGLKEVEPESLELARINRGSQFDVFKKIRLPNAIPFMFAGIKVAIVLSVTGAIVAEFVAPTKGSAISCCKPTIVWIRRLRWWSCLFWPFCPWVFSGWSRSCKEKSLPGAPRSARSKVLSENIYGG